MIFFSFFFFFKKPGKEPKTAWAYWIAGPENSPLVLLSKQELVWAFWRRTEKKTRMGGPSSECSSGEEDGDAEWKAAINSVATSSAFTNGSSATSNTPKTRNSAEVDDNDDDWYYKQKPQQPKLYQIKVSGFITKVLYFCSLFISWKCGR